MHHLIRRARPLRVALHAALSIALLAPAGHGLGASPAPLPIAAPLDHFEEISQ